MRNVNVVQATVASHFQKEQSSCWKRHARNRADRNSYLSADLVLQELGMLQERVVEYYEKAEGRQGEVHERSANVNHHKQTNKLAQSVILGPRGRINEGSEKKSVADIKNKVHFCSIASPLAKCN